MSKRAPVTITRLVMVAYSYTMEPSGGVVRFITVREAATLAGRTPETVRRWVWSGRLTAQRDGGRLLLERADVERIARGDTAGISPAPIVLADWAAMVRSTLGRGRPGGSAADLILADRADREAGVGGR